MAIITLRSPDAADLAAIEQVYRTSFPPEEQRPWEKIVAPDVPGRPLLQGIYADGVIAGLVTTWVFPGFTYVEHLAVSPAIRGGGTGAAVLEILKKTTGESPLLLEVEPESDSDPMPARRIGFYRRNGFEIIDYPYMQPPYAAGLPWLELRLMSTGPLDPSQASRILHHEVYGAK